MQLLNNIKSSIYNPAYYSEILSKPFSYSFRYFLSLAGLIAIVTTVVFSVSALPEINKVISGIGPSVMKYYPDNLEITVKNGKVSTNVPEPYYIKMPAEFKAEGRKAENESIKTAPDISEMENLLVIDTSSPLTADLFKNYKTAGLLSRDSIAYYDNKSLRIQSLDQTINGVVTKAKVSAALDEIAPYLKILPFVLVPIVFLFYFIGFIFGNLIYLIFGAFVIWLFAKATKKNWPYGKSYQIGMHAITLGVILDMTVLWFYPNLGFPFLFTILMLAIVWINLKFSFSADNAPPAPISVGKI